MRSLLCLFTVCLSLIAGAVEPLPDLPEAAWEAVQQAVAVKVPPLAVPGRLPTNAEMESVRQAKSNAALHCAALAGAFARKFPNDARAVAARNLCREGLNLAVRSGAVDRLGELEQIEGEILAKSGLSADQRFQLRAAAVERAATVAQAKGEDMLTAYEAGVRQLQREFPGRPELAQMLYAVAVRSSGTKARELAAEVRRTAPTRELKADAGKLIARADRIGKPLQVKFTSTLGEKIDTANYQGKVVLLNFWATWSAPSISQLTLLSKLANRFKDDGLVLLGISADNDRSALQAYLDHKPLPWPQCFDRDPNSPGVGETLGVEQIPAIWLIDRQGRLRFTDAALHLEESLQTLIAETGR